MPRNDRPTGFILDNGYDYLNSTPQERMDSQNLHDLLEAQEEANKIAKERLEIEKRKEKEERIEKEVEAEWERKQYINKVNAEVCDKYTYGDLTWNDISEYLDTESYADTKDIVEAIYNNDIPTNRKHEEPVMWSLSIGFVSTIILYPLVAIMQIPISGTAFWIIIGIIMFVSYIIPKRNNIILDKLCKEEERREKELKKKEKELLNEPYEKLYKFREKHYCQEFEDMFNEFEEYGLRPVQNIKGQGTMEDYINFFKVECEKIGKIKEARSEETGIKIDLKNPKRTPNKNQWV